MGTPRSTVNTINVLVAGHEHLDIVPSNAHTTEVRIVDAGGTMLGTMEEMEEGLGEIQMVIGTMITMMTLPSTTLTLKG